MTLLSDRYRVGPALARGGMGAVHEGEDLALERTVAIKVLAGETCDERRLLREAQALARLDHPGIVRLFDAGIDDGAAYLVMELVRGSTLAARLADAPLPSPEVARMGTQLAAALAHAHAHGVVHRDVSPGNVLLAADGRARLTDFGIAHLPEATRTMNGEIWGTPAYLAPEQLAGAEQVGPPADVYALGLILLEALTGRREFTGTPAEASMARLNRDPRVPAGLGGGWSPLLRAMTARDPQLRPPAIFVAERLAAPARTTARLPLAARRPAPRPAARPTSASGTPRTPKRWRTPAATAAAIALALGLVAFGNGGEDAVTAGSEPGGGALDAGAAEPLPDPPAEPVIDAPEPVEAINGVDAVGGKPAKGKSKGNGKAKGR